MPTPTTRNSDECQATGRHLVLDRPANHSSSRRCIRLNESLPGDASDVVAFGASWPPWDICRSDHDSQSHDFCCNAHGLVAPLAVTSAHERDRLDGDLLAVRNSCVAMYSVSCHVGFSTPFPSRWCVRQIGTGLATFLQGLSLLPDCLAVDPFRNPRCDGILDRENLIGWVTGTLAGGPLEPTFMAPI